MGAMWGNGSEVLAQHNGRQAPGLGLQEGRGGCYAQRQLPSCCRRAPGLNTVMCGERWLPPCWQQAGSAECRSMQMRMPPHAVAALLAQSPSALALPTLRQLLNGKSKHNITNPWQQPRPSPRNSPC